MHTLLMITLQAILGLTISTQALAFPLPKEHQRPDFFTFLSSEYNFEGIVALSNCSGSIIRFETSQDSDHAVVLTNGHCLETGFTAPNKVVYRQPSQRTFNILDPQAQTLGSVTATLVLYSTMSQTDMTLYQLRETYADIQKSFNVRAFTLASSHPEVGQPIEIISGFWKSGYQCHIDSFIPHLKEDGWTFSDSIKFSQPGCETIGGTSGSPLILAKTRTVIGVNNTGNESGERCTMDNACEVDKDGNISFHQGDNYGQQTFWIYSCLNSKNDLDLSLTGCQLPH